jgi:hypothetical protein
MSIDRHNYEEFFILYMDNELSSEQRREVELFVQANPDLQAELNMLQQSCFVADEAIVFDDKTSLLRFADCNISLDNYEEWLILYVDNELTARQKVIVESFAATHPAVQQEFSLFKQTKLQRENAVVFPDKESLYRKEETTRGPIVLRWWRVAAAAVLILAVAGGSYLAFNNDEPVAGEKTIAIRQDQNNDNNTSGSSVRKKDQQNVEIPTTDKTKKDEQTVANVKTGMAVQPVVNNKDNKKAIKVILPVNDHDPSVAVTNDKNRNNLPEPVYNPNITGKLDQNGAISLASSVNTKALTDLKENDVVFAVTPNTAPTLEQAVDVDDEPQPDKKNSKLRGFFRKVTRTVEKTTNLKTTDDDGRLLIAGLAIKL